MKRYILYIGIVAMFAISCQKDLQTEISTPVDYGEAVAVKLDFVVEGVEAGTAQAASKASSSSSDEVSSEVKNIWIIQFDGTDDGSEAIAAHYISSLSTTDNEVTLLPLGRPTAVVAIANTYNPDLIPMPLRMTLTEFKARHRTIVSNTLGTGAYWGDGVVSYGTSGNPYFILNDYRDVTVNSSGSVTYADEEDGSAATTTTTTDDEATGSNLSFVLKRNVAKVMVTLKNSWDDAKMLSATMNGVAAQSHFYTNRNDNDPLEAPFPSTDVATLRYDTHYIDSQDSETIVFYVPVNMQGVNELATDKTKPYYAPVNATYLTVILSQEDVENSAIEYRLYLGENLTNNYNLEPNKAYEYTIEFKGSGVVEGDYRVNEIGVVDYTARESANCYIINPSQEVDRVYYLPIEDRINEFWSVYCGTATDKIVATTNWEIEPLWYDTNTSTTMPTDFTLEQAVRDGKHAIKVTVPQNFSYHTNLIVAVTIDNEIVWSWHLWITDYNPDSRDYAVVANQYLYPVDGGYIERYVDSEENITITGPIWGTDDTQTGIYANMFMMDRNLGARDATRYGQGGNSDRAAGALFYQFGRKDPFPANRGYLFNNGVATTTSFKPEEDVELMLASFAYTVNNPMKFINSSTSWCSENVSNSYSYLWNDIKCANPMVDDKGNVIKIVESSGQRKSIFDPSPLGWRLPLSAVWNDYDTDSFIADSNAADEYQNNRSYTLTNSLYVANGYRDGITGAHNVGSLYNGYIWSSSPNVYLEAKQARALSFNLSSVTYNHSSIRANGYNVRCVMDNRDYSEVE